MTCSKYMRLLIAILILSVTVLLLIIASSCAYVDWGYPSYQLSIINQTNRTLTLTNNGNFVAEVTPGVEIITNYYHVPSQYLIEVKDDHGQIIYSKIYTFDELYYKLKGKMIITSP